MMRWKLRLPGFRHRFTIGGLNLEKFLNTVSDRQIRLLRAERTQLRAMECVCASADLAAIMELAEEKGWKMTDIHADRFSALVEHARKRPGVPVGAALALMLVLVLSQFVWNVEIIGAGATRADLSAWLAENGYQAGALRSRMDVKELEKQLTQRYPQIAWFHAYVAGVTLVVDVVQGVPVPEEPPHEAQDVLASQDGRIESVRVYAGTPQVKAGDLVRRGQVLIRGEERSSDGQTVPVAARGVVMARCWMSATVEIPLYEVLSTETGRESVSFRIRTPVGSWPAQWEKAEYLAANTYLEETPLGGSFFPLVRQRIIQREVSMHYAPRDLEEVRREATQAALEKLKTMLFGYDIIDKWVDYCMIEDEALAASVTAEWLMDIGGAKLP